MTKKRSHTLHAYLTIGGARVWARKAHFSGVRFGHERAIGSMRHGVSALRHAQRPKALGQVYGGLRPFAHELQLNNAQQVGHGMPDGAGNGEKSEGVS